MWIPLFHVFVYRISLYHYLSCLYRVSSILWNIKPSCNLTPILMESSWNLKSSENNKPLYNQASSQAMSLLGIFQCKISSLFLLAVCSENWKENIRKKMQMEKSNCPINSWIVGSQQQKCWYDFYQRKSNIISYQRSVLFEMFCK